MRTTLYLNDGLLQRATKFTRNSEKTSLVRMGLEAGVAAVSARRLADLGGTEVKLQPVPRKRRGRVA